MANLVPIQRGLLRAFGRIIDNLCSTRTGLNRMIELQIIPRLVKGIQGHFNGPPIVSLEASKLLVLTIRSSVRMNFSLLQELKKCNGNISRVTLIYRANFLILSSPKNLGYSNLITTALWLQNRGSEEEIQNYLDNVWDLAFIGEPFDFEVDPNVAQNRLGDVLMNMDVIKALLEIFEQSSSIFIQRLILLKLRKAFQQDSTNYSRSKSVKLFKYLVQKYQHLDQVSSPFFFFLLRALFS